MKTHTIQDLRFSGSYISRYMNCPGSAVLSEAIPGFESEDNRRKATTRGTRLHQVFQNILEGETELTEAAAMLLKLADVFGKKRIALLVDETAYITWWFLAEENYCEPPVPYSTIKLLHEIIPETTKYDEENDIYEVIPEKVNQTSPALIRFLAEALLFVHEIREDREGARLIVEETRVANWTDTKPETTADLVMTDGKTLDVFDFKTGTIPVDAAHNDQLLYYAQTYLTEEVEVNLYILQPKNTSIWALSDGYLETWRNQALEAEQRIIEGDRTLRPGSHCQFCPANPYSKGELGNPKCPAQIEVLFGKEDEGTIYEEDLDG